MSRRSRHKPGAATDPELPIVPMLDMSFQLMAFFILTFRPLPSEAQLALALPKAEGGGAAVPTLSLDAVQDEDVVVQVFAADTGAIASIKAVAKTGDVPLGADTGQLFQYLRDKAAASRAGDPGRPTPKLRIEMAERLNYQYVIKLLDEGVRAGYDRVTPALLSGGGPR